MPKTDISKILKKGASTKAKIVDYSTSKQKKKLRKLKERSELVLRNKNRPISDFYITL